MKVLMISTEYPPMKGGVGRYCKKLVDSLKKESVQVSVVCNEDGDGDYNSISPCNQDNSKVLLNIVKETEPDVIHVQYEPALYGLHLDPFNPRRTKTNIDLFYHESKVPIVTTFHSAYTFIQWMKLIVPLNYRRYGRVGTLVRLAYEYWTHLINYRSFNSLNRAKIGPDRAGVVFSKYLQNLIPGSYLIYQGSEPNVPPPSDKNELRKKFLIPADVNIALAVGFTTATKGWDLIKKMTVPRDWKIVINTSKNHYSKEALKKKFENEGVVDLNRGFLSDSELSLLFYSADALILPYKVSSGSGVMYDGLAHGLPFVSSKIEFFKEFSDMGLGISIDRDPSNFSRALLQLKQEYKKYKQAVLEFNKNLRWKKVTREHIILYNSIVNSRISISQK